MSQSNISLPIYDANLPAPKNFSANFTFSHTPDKVLDLKDRISNDNKVQDEPSNDPKNPYKTGYAPTPIGIAPLYVDLEFSKPDIQINPNKSSVQIATANGLILKNYDKLLEINHLSTNKITENTYIFVNGHDYDVENSLVRKMANLNLDIANSNADSVPKISFIEQAIKATLNKGTVFFDKDEKEKPLKLFNVLKNAAASYQLSEFYAYKIFLSTLSDPTTQFNFSSLFNSTTKQDPNALQRGRSINDYMIDLKNEVDVTDNITNNISVMHGELHVAIAGYVIEKTELNQQGFPTSNICKIIVDDGDASHYYDTNINYGFKYAYSISTIYLIQIPNVSTDPNSNGKNFFSFLLVSSQNAASVVETIDNTPPEPPTDFDVTWNYDTNKLLLSWNFPVQARRDIRKFQIFRRSDLNSSFQMIRQIDFSGSGPGGQNELNVIADPVDTSLNFVSKNPITFYIDDEFKKESKFIYSIVSVSNRGLTSNYSSQYEVSFDKFKNSLVKKIVSTQNAPKAYPNLYVPNVAFSQTISTNSFKTAKLIFNPQHFIARHDIIDPCIAEQLDNIVAFDSDKSEYQLTIINADLQQQQTVVVKIKDARSPDPSANSQLPT